jgi:putative transposase
MITHPHVKINLGLSVLRKRPDGYHDLETLFVPYHGLSDTLETAPVLKTVREAVERNGVPAIINSDQGSQFTSDDYKSLLKSLHIRQSMDGKSRWADNIMIERWFRSLKTEKIYIEDYATERELRACIDGFIDQYNNVRPHESLDNATPASVYAASFAA